LLEAEPAQAPVYFRRGRAYVQLGQWENAVADLARVVEVQPENVLAWHNRGYAQAARGRWTEAAADLTRATQLKETTPEMWVHHALLRLQLQDVAGYRTACARLRQLASFREDPYMLALMAWTCALVPNAVSDFTPLLQLTHESRDGEPKDYFQARALGAVLYRAGKVEEAVRQLNRAAQMRNGPAPAVWLLLALAQHGLKQDDEARRQLNQAVQWFEQASGQKSGAAVALPWDRLPWHEQLAFRVLHREATALPLPKETKETPDTAVAAAQEAVRLNPGDPMAHYRLGLSLARKGDLDAAIAAHREALRLQPGLASAHAALGNALASQGAHEAAIAALREALRLQPRAAGLHYNLGNVFLQMSAFDAAAGAFREAVRLEPDFAEAHCNLGHALMRKGQFTDALAALQRGHELGSRQPGWRYPSQQWVRDCERRGQLDRRLAAVLRGEAKPADTAERLEFAGLLHYQQRYGLAASFYEEALASRPGTNREQTNRWRYAAACAAALAGCGRGPDAAQLNDGARARWRKEALCWLQAELNGFADQQTAGPPQAREQIAKTLQRWKRDPDLAGLRDEKLLAALPEEERPACRRLWAGVEALLARCLRRD
jgi:tetratricopeptide (TPR) repeat protein